MKIRYTLVFNLVFIILAVLQGCSNEISIEPAVKIPFDSTRVCTQVCNISLDSTAFNMFTLENCLLMECPDGNLLLSKGALIQKVNCNGKIIWTKVIPGCDYITHMQSSEEGGYFVSGAIYRENTDADGNVHSTHTKIIFRIDENAELIWKAVCKGMDAQEGNELIELGDGILFVYGTYEYESSDLHASIEMNFSHGKKISEKKVPYELTRLKYQGNKKTYYRIEWGEGWDGERRTGYDHLKVQRLDEHGNPIWKQTRNGAKMLDPMIPNNSLMSEADEKGVFLCWNNPDYSIRKDKNGGRIEMQNIHVSRYEEKEEGCFTKTFFMDSYTEIFDIKKVKNKWRIAGLSGIKTITGGGVPAFCNRADISFRRPKKFFVTEFDEKGNIYEVKCFYKGEEVKSASLTNDGIIFIGDGKLIKAKW